MNFYFILGHPNNILPFAQIAEMLKNSYSHAKTTAIIYNHPFLKDCDYHQFLKTFDTVHMLPMADIHSNIIKGFAKTIKCKNSIKSIKIEDESIIFTFRSMEWVVNLLLKHIKRTSKESKIIFCDISEQPNVLGKKSIFRSSLYFLYALLFNGYLVYSYVNPEGVIVNRKYFQKLYDHNIYISALRNIEFNKPDELDSVIRVPYPIYKTDSTNNRSTEKIVLFFGDATYFEFYPELDKSFFYDRLNSILHELRKKYLNNDIILYYKPHPLDKGKVMQNIDLNNFRIFEERLTAEMIYALYWDRIVAAYSVSSSSSYYASQSGIPAYVLYKYCWSNDQLKEKMSRLFGDTSNPLFKEVTTLEDICSIDGLKADINTPEIEEKWKIAFGIILKKFSQL